MSLAPGKGDPMNIDNLIFDRITSLENLEKAYKKSQEGKLKYKKEALIFALDETQNLRELREELVSETYQFSGYFEFEVFKPKRRIINAPHYRDKIVQLATNNILKDIFVPGFISHTYACLDGRGTHRCVDKISEFSRKALWEYGPQAYIVKIDVKKFFYSLDRDVLKKYIRRKLKDEKALRLIYKIINSADSIDPLGMPLGNTISQLSANITMNAVDQYCKRTLSIKYYARYADDVVIIARNKEEASWTLDAVSDHMEKTLNLKTNRNKSMVFPISQGVNTVGFKIHPTHRLLRNDSKKNVKQKLRKMRRFLVEELMTPQKAEQILNSWYGHAKNGSSFNFVQKLLRTHNYIRIDGKSIKINTEVIDNERIILRKQ
jgi:RNA-directed DNA polymerase